MRGRGISMKIPRSGLRAADRKRPRSVSSGAGLILSELQEWVWADQITSCRPFRPCRQPAGAASLPGAQRPCSCLLYTSYRLRPGFRFAFSAPSHAIALFFGAGCLRPGPGTWGSLAAALVFLLFEALIPASFLWIPDVYKRQVLPSLKKIKNPSPGSRSSPIIYRLD